MMTVAASTVESIIHEDEVVVIKRSLDCLMVE